MLKLDRRLFENFDWLVLGTILFISITGILTIYSATRPLPGSEQPSFYIKQIYWLLFALIGFIFAVSLDYNALGKYALHIFIAGIILLIAVLIAGRTGMGAQRWISIGPLNFQPSEFFKIAFIIVIARHLSQKQGNLSLKDIVYAFSIYLLIPFLLVLKQPDLGTGLVLFLLFSALSIAKGIRKHALALALAISLISVPFMGTIVWDGLKDYQKKRILAFVQPDADPEGISYHINQSKVAVGSGRISGKGYLKGTQGPFRFLPEKHTDFIFSVFAEEWGFTGSMFLLVAFLILLMRGLNTALKAKDEFGQLLALGITFMFSIYCFVNIGMTLGLMPVVGLPLPFMSYGGTALVGNYIAAGILISIRVRRFELFY